MKGGSQLTGGSPRYPAVRLGPLPVDAINHALGTELQPGIVRLSATAHAHLAEDHPEDYAACFAALPQAIATPTFVGQAPEHTRNFEIVMRIPRPDRRAILVAVGLEPDDRGSYRVRTAYTISAEVVDARRRRGTLKPLPPK